MHMHRLNTPEAPQVSKSAEQVADAVSEERRQLDAIETAREIGYRDGHIDGRNEARAQTASAASPVAGVSATLQEFYGAASAMDWGQVAANGGPPCFHIEYGRFCGRAGRWEGHKNGMDHAYIPLDILLSRVAKLAQPSAEGDGAYDAFLTGEVLYHENRLTVTNGRIGLYWHDDAGHAHKLGDYITPEQEAVFRERMEKGWKPRKLAEGDGWIAVTERLSKALDLLDRIAEGDQEAPDPTWNREYYELRGWHVILTEEGWQPGDVKNGLVEEYGESHILDELNAPTPPSV